MIQVRSSVFETNSSSTHSICIPKKTNADLSDVYFGIGEYGWENDSVDPASYLYTAILCYGYDAYEEKLSVLSSILDKHGLSYTYEEPKWDEWNGRMYLEYGCIDHAYETREFVEAVLKDDDMLLRFLSDGSVYTGNDNQEDDYGKCDVALEYMYDYETGEEIPNPHHDEEKYDYFYKGN